MPRPRVNATRSRKGRRQRPSRRRATMPTTQVSLQSNDAPQISQQLRRPARYGNFRTIGFPDEYRCLLRYHETIPSAGSGGVLTQIIFNANSLYDPYAGLGGHQPTYFDQLSSVYRKYCVVACQASLRFVNTSATEPVRVVLTASDNATSSSIGLDGAAEGPYAWSTIVGNASTPTVLLSSPMLTTAKISGQPTVLSDPDMYSSVLSNPVDLWYFICWAEAIDSVAAYSGHFTITLTFQCVFKELYDPGESLKSGTLSSSLPKPLLSKFSSLSLVNKKEQLL